MKWTFCADGKTIAEYALIFALVAIALIPALQFLGSAIERLYVENEPTSQAQELFALLSPGAGGGEGKASPAGGPAAVSFPEESAASSSDTPDSLRMSGLLQPSVNTDGTAITSTSVPGKTLTAARQLEQIAEQGRLPDGTPVSDEMADVIEDMAAIAKTLADDERHYLDGSDEADVITGGSLKNFSIKYSDMLGKANGSANNKAVLQVVDYYSGIITYGATGLVGEGTQYHRGTDPGQTFAAEVTPVVTDQSAEGLSNTAQSH